MESAGRRIAWRLGHVAVAARWNLLVGFVGGFALGALLPVTLWWLPGVVAGGLVLLAVAFAAIGERMSSKAHRPLEELRAADRAVVHEWANGPQQLAAAFGAAGLSLAGVSLGAGLAIALGL